jgi:hypothetical protein
MLVFLLSQIFKASFKRQEYKMILKWGVIQKKTSHAAHAGFFIFSSFLKQALSAG